MFNENNILETLQIFLLPLDSSFLEQEQSKINIRADAVVKTDDIEHKNIIVSTLQCKNWNGKPNRNNKYFSKYTNTS